LLALDLRKGFDSVAPDRLLWALKRYGVREDMLSAIKEIYTDRVFTVAGGGRESELKRQRAGISQGCPISPFLFGMLISMLMSDVQSSLNDDANAACVKGDLEDILYADDTLLISRRCPHSEEHMASVEQKGADHGLRIHWAECTSYLFA